jgi:hypothetical protein
MDSVLFIPSIAINIVNKPLQALSLLALRVAGANEILKRLSYDSTESDVRQVAYTGGLYFRTASQEQRFELAQHCLATAIATGNKRAEYGCYPSNFGITNPTLAKELIRMRFEHGTPDEYPTSFRIGAHTLNAHDREFRVEMLSRILGHGGEPWQILKGIDLDQLGHLQAQKRHLEELSTKPSQQRRSGQLAHHSELPISDPEIRVELAREYMRLLPQQTCLAIANFRLEDAEARFELAIQAATLGSAEVARNLASFRLTAEQRGEVIQRVLETNAAGALPNMSAAIFPLPTDALQKTFSAAIEHGKWSNAMKLCELQRTGNTSIADRSVIKSDFQRLFTLGKQNGGISEESSAVLEKVLAIGCAPSDSLGHSLKYFGPANQEFLLEILRGNGESFGGSVLNELERIFPPETPLDARDRDSIRNFLSHGFRGFSPSTYHAFRERWESSPAKAASLMKEWKDLTQEILDGRPTRPESASNPLFAELVYAAYRPTGFNLSHARLILGSQRDQSAHCADFKAPTNGYRISVREISARAVKSGSELHLDQLRSHADRAIAPLPEGEFTEVHLRKLGILALQGNFKSLRESREALLQYLVSSGGEGRANVLVSELRELRDRGFGPAEAFDAIPRLIELQGVVFKDLLAERLTNLVKSGDLRPGAKLQAQVRTILKISPDRDIKDSDTLEALTVQFSKLFSEDLRFLKAERQKIALTLGDRGQEFDIILTKSLPSFFGRAGAGLCTAQDIWSWTSKTFLQMTMVDREARRIVGNIQLHLFTDPAGKEAIIARLNPVESLLSKVDSRALAKEMIGAVRQFSDDNGLTLYLPENTSSHLLTNRGGFVAPLQAYYGEAIQCAVKLTSAYTCVKAYRCLEAPES